MEPDPKRQLLRHAVAAIAFRANVALRDAPPGFADFRATGDTRSPVEILAHLSDLLNGSRLLLMGDLVELSSVPGAWSEEIERFSTAVRLLDEFLGSDVPLAHTPEKMIQGPIGDALTHVGQIVILRRIAGAPIEPEPYFTAEIVPGVF